MCSFHLHTPPSCMGSRAKFGGRNSHMPRKKQREWNLLLHTCKCRHESLVRCWCGNDHNTYCRWYIKTQNVFARLVRRCWNPGPNSRHSKLRFHTPTRYWQTSSSGGLYRSFIIIAAKRKFPASKERNPGTTRRRTTARDDASVCLEKTDYCAGDVNLH